DDPSLPRFERFDGDVKKFWRGWIGRGYFEWESDGHPWWGNLHHTATYWPHRNCENVLLVHYNDLKADLPPRCGESPPSSTCPWRTPRSSASRANRRLTACARRRSKAKTC